MSTTVAVETKSPFGPYVENWNFPHPPRTQQVDVLSELDALDHLIVLVEAPTGIGKSPICATVAHRDSGVILTPQKILQDQYERDWPSMPLLKGTCNYKCSAFTGADCEKGGAVRCKDKQCPYKAAKAKFLDSPVGVTNYAYFFQALKSEGFNIDNKNWIICINSNTMLNVLHNGRPVAARAEDVAQGFGDQLIGERDASVSYSPITRRLYTGRHEIWVVSIRTEHGVRELPITGNGLVWADGQYRRTCDLANGMQARVLTPCPTYHYEPDKINDATSPVPVWLRQSDNTIRVCQALDTVGLYEIPAGTPIPSEQNRVDTPSATTHTWDVAGGRIGTPTVHPIRRAESKNQDKTFDEEADGILPVAVCRTQEHLRDGAKAAQVEAVCEVGPVWQRSAGVQYALPPVHTRAGTQTVHAQEDGNAGVPGPARRLRACGVVDGRRIIQRASDSLVHASRATNDQSVVDGAVACDGGDRAAQEGTATLSEVPTANDRQIARHSGTAYHSKPVLQVPRTLSQTSIVGEIVSIRRTGTYEHTYDFTTGHGNFFANGVLIHNCDEAHALEDALISAAEITMTAELRKLLEYSKDWPTNQDDAIDYTLGIRTPLVVKMQTLRGQVEGADGAAKLKAAKELVILTKLRHSLDYFASSHDQEEWVWIDNDGDYPGFRMRPLLAKRLFQEIVEPLKKRVLMLSATMPPVRHLARWLGVDPETSYRIQLDSPFSIENRPFRVMPAADMSRKGGPQSVPTMAAKIAKLLDHYDDVKGIVHCHSFILTEKLANHLESMGYKNRLLVQRKGVDRDALLATHQQSKGPTVLMSPSMTEGLDLKDDLSRFTIFAKIPWPYLGDAWTKRRADEDSDWYGWQTLKSIIQGTGRSVRHDEDWAEAFMLDSGFEAFWSRYGRLAPDWFANAIIW